MSVDDSCLLPSTMISLVPEAGQGSPAVVPSECPVRNLDVSGIPFPGRGVGEIGTCSSLATQSDTLQRLAASGRTQVSHTDCISAMSSEAIEGLRAVGREFHGRGWSVGTSSNYSVVVSRSPLELLVTASGKDKGNLSRDDFVRVGQTGAPLEAGQPKSSAETLLHVVLAQQPGVGAVLHTHSVWATLLSDLYFEDGGLAIEGYEMLKGLEGITTHEHRQWVTIFDNTQDIPDLAGEVAARLGDANRPLQHGFLIRRHGLYAWGKDLFEARRHVEVFEFLFECVARNLTLRSVGPETYHVAPKRVADFAGS